MRTFSGSGFGSVCRISGSRISIIILSDPHHCLSIDFFSSIKAPVLAPGGTYNLDRKLVPVQSKETFT